MKDQILIRKLANGFMVHDRTDLIANEETYVFNDFEAMVTFLKMNFAKKDKK